MAVPITDHVSVTISSDSRSVTRANFGIPMLIGYHTAYVDRVRSYTSLSGLATDLSTGYANHPIYLMASALLAQNPRVERFKVGRRALGITQHVHVTVLTDSISETISVSISKGGVTRTYSKVGGGAGIPAEATAIAALMNADASGWGTAGLPAPTLTIAAAGNDISLTAIAPANVGQIWYYGSGTNVAYQDLTTDPGIATDLTAIQAADDDFYAVLLDSCGVAEIPALATAVEALRKIYIAQTQDSDCMAAGLGVGGTLHSANRARTALIWSNDSMAEYPACAFVGKCLPYEPGQATWCYKTLSGVTASNQTDAQYGYLKSTHTNHVVSLAGVDVTRFGNTCNGSYIDRRILADWVQARIEEAIVGLFVNNPKLPYNDVALDMLDAEIYGVYKLGAENGGFELSDYSFSATAAGDQTSGDRLARIMRGVEFGGKFSDAVHQVYVTGTIV